MFFCFGVVLLGELDVDVFVVVGVGWVVGFDDDGG